MKLKHFILLSLVLFLTNSIFSQSFNAGFLAGVNASQVSGDGYGGFNKAGLLLGLFTNVDLSSKINFQAEINYSQKGSRKNPNTAEGDTEFFLLRMNYIDVPVMVRTDYKNFVFEGGFYYGQLINYYLETTEGPTDLDPTLNQFNNYDVGFLFGINYQFTESLIMNWRYNNSALHFREHDSGAQFRFDSGMFHNYISFALRYQFYGEKN